MALDSHHDAAIWGIYVPAFFTIMLEVVQGLIDTALVGRLGTVQLAAVGVGNFLFGFSVGCFGTFGCTTTAQVAAAKAAGQDRKAAQELAKSMWMAALCGVLLFVLLTYGSPMLVSLLVPDATVAAEAVKYLRIRALAGPPALALMALSSGTRGLLDGATPLQGACVQYGLNLALGAALMYGLGAGVAGAAAAGAAAVYVGCAVVLALAVARRHVRWRELMSWPRWPDAQPYIKAGGAILTSHMTYNAMAMLGNRLAAAGGAPSLAAHTVLRQVMGLCMQAFGGFNIAAQTLVAAQLGRGDKRTARDVLLRIGTLAVAVSLPAVVALMAGRGALLGLFTQDDTVKALAAATLPLVIASMPLDALGAASEGGLLGSLNAQFVAKRTLISSVVAVAIMAASQAWGPWLLGVWVGTKAIQAMCLAFDVWFYRSPRGVFGQPQRMAAVAEGGGEAKEE